MVLVVAAVVVIPLALSRGKHQVFDRCYTGAFASHSLPCVAGMLAGAVLFAVGGFLAPGPVGEQPHGPHHQPTVHERRLAGHRGSLPAGGCRDLFRHPKMRQGKPILTAWVVTPGFACALW